MSDNVIATVMIIVLVVVGFFAVLMSIEAGERAECRKWQEDNAANSDFYIVQWQKDQCDRWEIPVNAEVK